MEDMQFVRVLLLSPLPPPIGGITSWTEEFCKRISKFGCEVDLINTSVIGKRLNHNREINYLDEIKRLYSIRSKVKTSLLSNDIQVIHYNASCFTFGLLRDYFVLQAARRKVPILYQCHCNLPTRIHNRFIGFLFSKVVNQCDKVMVLNEQSYTVARNYHDNVVKIPNFITGVICEYKECNKELKNLVFVGRVCREKGIYELLDAMKVFPEIMLHIIGPDPRGILASSLPPNINYHGEMSHEQVLTFIQDMDAFVLPTYSEGFPLSILEAMACGLPIVATNVGAIPEMLLDKGGIIVPSQDKQALVDGIEDIKSRDKRQSMSDYNILTVKSQFTVDVVLRELSSIYYSYKKCNMI